MVSWGNVFPADGPLGPDERSIVETAGERIEIESELRIRCCVPVRNDISIEEC